MSERIYEQALMIIPGVCFECEGPAEHRHHVVPDSRGGKRVVWLCESCHEKTHGFEQGRYAMMRARREELRAEGRYMGGNRIRRRYGMQLIKVMDRWCYRPIPAEQEVIVRIGIACSSGMGYAAMAKVLNVEGVPTVSGAPWSKKFVRDLAIRGPDTKP